VEAMNLPLKHPDGQLMVYKFHHATAGQLRDEQTLAVAGVRDGDVLRIYPELIAGLRNVERKNSSSPGSRRSF
jgi:hypothetical protein